MGKGVASQVIAEALRGSGGKAGGAESRDTAYDDKDHHGDSVA